LPSPAGPIGPEGTPRDYDGSLDGTPVFIGCSDQDPHIPLERVNETAEVLDDLDADVDERIYEGMGHTVNEDELDAVDEADRFTGELRLSARSAVFPSETVALLISLSRRSVQVRDVANGD